MTTASEKLSSGTAPLVVTIGMAVGGFTMVAPPPVIASDVRTPYTTYTLTAQDHQASDRMAHDPTLENAIKELAEQVRALREDKPKKSIGEHVATWGPAVAVIAVMVTMLGVNTRVGDLEKKVDKGFADLTTAIHALDIKLTHDEAVASAPASSPTPATRR